MSHEEAFPARLTGTPPHLRPSGEVHIQPVPFPVQQPPPTQPPIEIQLPNIHVQYPSQPPPPPPSPPTPRSVVPMPAPTPRPRWGMRKPHPLLWLTLALSLLALVLQVPKGQLPTLTGRHRALREQERLVAEKLALVTQLATFLPPPLAALVAPPAVPGAGPSTSLQTSRHPHGGHALDVMAVGAGLRFWRTSLGANGEGHWWSVDELGDGASVVRSKLGEQEREVWVLRTAEGAHDTAPLLASLTHSLLARDRLQAELDTCRATPCPASGRLAAAPVAYGGRDEPGDADEQRRHHEWESLLDERRKHEREREAEVEERERDVARREKWVVEEMRKLSDKVHAQATELTLEDRITERLKAYQRQLAHLSHDDAVASERV